MKTNCKLEKNMFKILWIFFLIDLTQFTVVCSEFNKKGALFRCIGDKFIERYGFSTEILNSCQNNLGSKSERLNRLLSYTGNPSKNKTQTRTDILMKRFNLIDNNDRQRISLIKLINKIAKEYLSGCSAIIYYDSFAQNTDYELLRMLFKSIPLAYQQVELDGQHQPRELIDSLEGNCNNFILFLTEPRMARKVIGPQLESKVVIISRSSQWKIRDFLASKSSADLLNLLVIGESQTYKGTEVRIFIVCLLEHRYSPCKPKLFANQLIILSRNNVNFPYSCFVIYWKYEYILRACQDKP